MECNKEEAFRAKTIADKKMQEKDFVGARKFALKAQQLYPETENITQMICVCDVHCSAESKIFGNESDWYGVLQVEQTADEALIKKQYRKLALLLHPDKNKFSGAEAAFKLIGEAQRVLLDKEKKSFYDMKRRTYKPVVTNQASKQTCKGFNATSHSRVQRNFVSNPSPNVKGFSAPFQEQKQQPQSGAANGGNTFWTQCPFCNIRYQFYREVLDRALRCQTCSKPFIALNLNDQATRPRSSTTQPVFPPKDASNVRVSRAGYEAMNQKPTSNPGSQAELNKSQKARQSQKGSRNVRGEWEQGSQSSKRANGKRGRKQTVESSESFDTDTSDDSEELEMQSDTPRAQQCENVGDSHTRRSSRNKRHVSYNENASDDDETMSTPKRAKGSSSSPSVTEKSDASGKEQPSRVFSPASGSVSEERKGVRNNSDGGEAVVEPMKKTSEAENGSVGDSSTKIIPEPTFYEYPDPEFCDFDKGREEHCFKVGQVWAAYDTVDAMPRFYARIKKVHSVGFKLRITWLEPDPDDEDGKKWAKAELPFSCGKFKFGNSEYTEDRLMFSHEVYWDKGSGGDSMKIYPKRGETWALFKNWDAKWYEVPENERKFEYEFVEVISEYVEGVGIRVAHLGKLKGFASLFCRVGGIEVQIPSTEVLRFAHRVPSYRMTGNERKDVPKGSFELDPACIAMKVEEISLPKVDGQTCLIDLSNSPEANPSVEIAKKSASIDCDDEVEDVNDQDLPDSEFFNFDDTKSVEKFQVNQVWALYSDKDGLPKYYGLIKKIDPRPNFKLHIAWLEAYRVDCDMVLWKDKDMPISCGQFKVKSGGKQQFSLTSSFSHQLRADQTGKKNVFAIYPRKGEIWALYKNWRPDMTSLGLTNCEYDIGEVLEENSLYTRVSILERVDGLNAVFKPWESGSSYLTKEIPRVELLRFSHQIPSFRLTDEKGGSLRGCMELDPAALPSHVLHKSK